MELGIKGHLTRGYEVIKILEMLGSKNCYNAVGNYDNNFYHINNHNEIVYSYIGPDEIKGYEIFSLEDFLEKFPYQVGDKVNVWVNYEYLSGPRAELEVSEIKSMKWNSARCEIAYRLKDKSGEFYKNKIKGKVDDNSNKTTKNMEDNKLFSAVSNPVETKSCTISLKGGEVIDNSIDASQFIQISKIVAVCFNTENYENEVELKLGDYEIVIRDGKTYAVKRKPTYPKTYDECCNVLSMEYATHYNLRYFTYERGFYEYATTDKLCSLQDKLNILGKLIICRNAYWKIAGEEMRLGKPWEPKNELSTRNKIYDIRTYCNKIEKGSTEYPTNKLLSFPTEEMRDVFYDNFKYLIETCKELL